MNVSKTLSQNTQLIMSLNSFRVVSLTVSQNFLDLQLSAVRWEVEGTGSLDVAFDLLV